MFLVIWHRKQKRLSIVALGLYLRVLRELAEAADRDGVRLAYIFQDKAKVQLFAMQCSPHLVRTLLALVKFLQHVDPAELGFKSVRLKDVEHLRQVQYSYEERLRQHAPIPTRIFSAVLTAMVKELADFEAHASALFALIQQYAEPGCGDLAKRAAEARLSTYLAAKHVARTRQSLGSEATRIQAAVNAPASKSPPAIY